MATRVAAGRGWLIGAAALVVALLAGAWYTWTGTREENGRLTTRVRTLEGEAASAAAARELLSTAHRQRGVVQRALTDTLVRIDAATETGPVADNGGGAAGSCFDAAPPVDLPRFDFDRGMRDTG